MDGMQRSDPFTWEVDTVCDQLSGPSITWARDPGAFRAKVIEEGIDGRTLLTLEHLLSKQELLQCLDVTLVRHKAAFIEFVVNLRSRSKQYQEWFRDWTKKQNFDQDDASPASAGLQGINTQPTANPAIEAGLSSTTDPVTQDEHGDGATTQQTPSKSTTSAAGTIQAVKTSPSRQYQDVDRTQDDADEERPAKRKRLAPTNLLTAPLGSVTQTLPTEADFISIPRRSNEAGAAKGAEDEELYPWESASAQAYLGNGRLEATTIKDPNNPLSSRVVSLGSDQFTTALPNTIPRGRRLVVARAMRRLLVRNSQREAMNINGFGAPRSSTPSDSDDQVLDLQDLPDYFDEETQREIDAERLEMEQYMAAQKENFLSTEQVGEVLDQCMRDMTTNWEEKRLPKHQRRANRIWNDARRRGTRVFQILRARRQAKFFNDRLSKLREGILDERWAKESEIRLQAKCLEQNLEDKLYEMWLISMLESRLEPPKPPRMPKRRKAAAVPRPSNFVDGDLVTSSDEDDFVVPDDAHPGHLREAGSDLQVPEVTSSDMPELEEDSTIFMDLTQMDSPDEKGYDMDGSMNGIIDLTTPTKSRIATDASAPKSQVEDEEAIMDQLLRIESFEEVEAIGKVSARYWARENDRFKLVIYLIYHLPSARRAHLLQLLRDFTLDKAWEFLKDHLSRSFQDTANPEIGEDRLAAFDLSRSFRCFCNCRVVKEQRMRELGDRDRKAITQDTMLVMFQVFRTFLLSVEPYFPQASQIYHADLGDLLDDDEFAGLDSAGDKASRKAGKIMAREIIQNKDAVDLRERERLRLAEQEQRRRKLRLALEHSGTMSQDKSRLIINETKEDDQGFIYINEDIGTLIKDHQIDGVRFLWNQLILDADTRQGCLLAHTMGLGKTMQVVTLLVAIMEASHSPDATVRSQIPEDLRKSQTLVLCPSGLVDNWMDELLLWAPKGCLGPLRKVDAQLSEFERVEEIQQWGDEGGILLIGYRMFTQVLKIEECEATLLRQPRIVVADEAHNFKNPAGKLHSVCSQFKTNTRIAMTGSPLANHVEEYHSMIDWVAPNFLGPLREFRDIYATPIQQGLWSDSLGFEKRRALKMLQVLKETCAPKMDRKTINSCLKQDLPPKLEFVIAVAPTPLQEKLYTIYLNSLSASGCNTTTMPQAELFNIVNNLALICNHPMCFDRKAKEEQEKLSTSAKSSFPEDAIPQILKETAMADLISPSLSLKVELLTMILDEARRLGDKVLVFSQSIVALDYLMMLFGMQKRRVCRLDGHTAIGKRQAMIKDFNSGEQEVYLISTMAGGVGLNIQGANRVVIFDFKWNPVNDQQAIGRAYRIGQNKPVFVYRFVTAGTFEEAMHNKAVFKLQLASRVVDKKNPVSWSNRLGKLIHPIKPVEARDLTPFRGKDEILDKLIDHKTAGGAVRYIVSTDTFEEEEPNDKLTAEERREAENLVNMNRLRVTNPQEYEKAKQRERQAAEIQRANLATGHNTERRTIPSTSTPTAVNPPSTTGAPTPMQPVAAHMSNEAPQGNSEPTSHPPIHRTTDGASDAVDVEAVRRPTGNFGILRPQNGNFNSVNQRPLFPATQRPLQPMPGANTYFGHSYGSTPYAYNPGTAKPAAHSPVLPAAPIRPAQNGHAAFTPQPSRDPGKIGFQLKLQRALEALQRKNAEGIAGPPPVIAHNIASSVEQLRAEKAYGFLPDMQQWKMLETMLQHDRFVRATVTGRLTDKFLAFANGAEMEARVTTLNGLSEDQSQVGLAIHRDPQNLENIRRANRSHAAGPANPKARDDLKVMREAADNRKRRGFRLPSWANQALSETSGAVFSRNPPGHGHT